MWAEYFMSIRLVYSARKLFQLTRYLYLIIIIKCHCFCFQICSMFYEFQNISLTWEKPRNLYKYHRSEIVFKGPRKQYRISAETSMHVVPWQWEKPTNLLVTTRPNCLQFTQNGWISTLSNSYAKKFNNGSDLYYG